MRIGIIGAGQIGKFETFRKIFLKAFRQTL